MAMNENDVLIHRTLCICDLILYVNQIYAWKEGGKDYFLLLMELVSCSVSLFLS